MSEYHSTYNLLRKWRYGIFNSFNKNCDYFIRLPAAETYYETADRCLNQVISRYQNKENSSIKKIEVQIGIANTLAYPSALGIPASLAQTAIIQARVLLEGFSSLTLENVAQKSIDSFLLNTNKDLAVELAKIVSSNVSTYVAYEELREDEELNYYIDCLLFYLCNIQDFKKLETIDEITRAAIMFGEFMPEFQSSEIHPFSKKILSTCQDISRPFMQQMKQSKGKIKIAKAWVVQLMKSLEQFIPAENGQNTRGKGEGFANHAIGSDIDLSQEFPPLNESTPPMFRKPELDQVLQSYLQGSPISEKSNNSALKQDGPAVELPDELKQVIEDIKEMAKDFTTASSDNNHLEKYRSDLLQDQLKESPFKSGIMEGSVMQTTKVKVQMGNEAIDAKITEQVLEPSFDMEDVNRLKKEAEPITRKLEKDLFVNFQDEYYFDDRKTTGMLDKALIHKFAFSDVLFKKTIAKQEINTSEGAVLCLLLDSSGSMGKDKFQLLKILTAGILESSQGKKVEILAGLYNQTYEPGQGWVPFFRWLYNREKSVAIETIQPVNCIASLSKVESGDGGQDDSLMVSHMLTSADLISRRRSNIYLLHISDLGFISSFGRNAFEEVFEVVDTFKKKTNRLTYMLVSLGSDRDTGILEEVIDHSITLPAGQLDPVSAAEQVAVFVKEIVKSNRAKT